MRFQITTNKDALYKQLKEYRENLVKYMDAIIKGICGVIRDKAQAVYGGSVSVTVEPLESGNTIVYQVRANGEAVVFIEFGAGDRTDSTNEYAYNLAVSSGVYVYAGSWSRREGNASLNPTVHPNYYEDGYWMLNRTKMTYVEPKRALYNAVHDSRAEFLQIINANKAIINSTVVTV